VSNIKGVGPRTKIVSNDKGGQQSELPYRFDLIPPEVMFAIARVFAQGAKKYELNNWLKIARHDHLNHAEAHLQAYKAGDTQDEHLEHFVVRAIMGLAVKEDGFPYAKT